MRRIGSPAAALWVPLARRTPRVPRFAELRARYRPSACNFWRVLDFLGTGTAVRDWLEVWFSGIAACM